MEDLIRAFPSHLQHAIRIANEYEFQVKLNACKNVFVFGMGGSGIGAQIVKNFADQAIPVPFAVVSGYEVPLSVTSESLAIFSSYSGDTEEVLTCLKEVQSLGCPIVCITSGGQLQQVAKKKGYDCIIVPAGMPPRAALAYSIVQIMATLDHFRLVEREHWQVEFTQVIEVLVTNKDDMHEYGMKLAVKIKNKIPVIYSGETLSAVATRFRQQLNENAKVLAWERIVPEMNHNELVGWTDGGERFIAIFLESSFDHPQVKKRFAFMKREAKRQGFSVLELSVSTGTYWWHVLYFIHVLDWFSFYLARFNDVDPMPVKIIGRLKKYLAK